MGTKYVGQYSNIYEGEEAIYRVAPQKKKGILSQIAASDTLAGARQKASEWEKAYIIYATDKGKYYVYI